MGSRGPWLAAETTRTDTLRFDRNAELREWERLNRREHCREVNFSILEYYMDTSMINKFRVGGFIGACVAAVLAFMSGDAVTAGGIIAAALSTAGVKAE